MNFWFLLLPAWYIFWIFVVVAFDAWKKRPWRRKLHLFLRLLLRDLLILSGLCLVIVVITMLIKGRPFTQEGWSVTWNKMLPVWCIMMALPVISVWEKVREEEKTA